jgi:hypothetical protein
MSNPEIECYLEDGWIFSEGSSLESSFLELQKETSNGISVFFHCNLMVKENEEIKHCSYISSRRDNMMRHSQGKKHHTWKNKEVEGIHKLIRKIDHNQGKNA